MSELEARTEIRHLRDMVYGLEQKIARLTAERDELQRKSDELALEFARDTKKILELKDERDRLTIIADAIQAERDRLFEENGKLAAVYAERDWLRSALGAAYTGLLACSVWLTPNVGGWALDQFRAGHEKLVEQTRRALEGK